MQTDPEATEEEGSVFKEYVVLTKRFFSEVVSRVCGFAIHGMNTEQWFVRPDMLIARQLRPQDGKPKMTFRLPELHDMFNLEGVDEDDLAIFQSIADVDILN